MTRKKNAATNNGAAEEVKHPNPHEARHALQVEEIAKLQRQSRDEQNAELGNVPVPITDEVIDASSATPVPDPTPTPDPDPVIVAAPPADDDFDVVKIDGVEAKVEKSKIYETGKRALQKELTADKRLQDVATRETALAAREAEVQRLADEANARLANAGGDELELDEAEIGSIVQAIKYGDDTKTAEGLKQLVKTVRGAKATKGGTLTQAEVRAIVRQERDLGSFESALEFVKKPQNQGGFGDLFDGGMIEHAFRFEDDRLAKDADGKNLSYLDRMKKAGENVRAKFKNPTNSSPNNDSETNEQRNARLADTALAAGGAPAGGKQQVRAAENESQRHARVLAEQAEARRKR
jgi:hypothetical protein